MKRENKCMIFTLLSIDGNECDELHAEYASTLNFEQKQIAYNQRIN